MSIIGHGIDLVELSQFGARLARYGDDDVLESLFTLGELMFAGDGDRRIPRLAGIFAAKEAVLKALGTGWVDGIAWTDVEIGSSETGSPTVRLHAQTAELAMSKGIHGWVVSISNSDSLAVASAIALGEHPVS